MVKFFNTLSLIIILLSSISCKENNDNNNIDYNWLLSNYSKREVMITMRDGVNLFTSIYEPRDTTKARPILLSRTCYSVAPYSSDEYKDITTTANIPYLRDGYIFVFQDVRGMNHSEGEFADIRAFITDKTDGNGNIDSTKIDEASDTYDTAEWLIHNTHSNGNIGVYGISYPGFYASMATLSAHPAIKAVSPQAPVTDWFRGDDVHHNGALFLHDMFGFDFWFQYMQTDAIRNGEFDADTIWEPSKEQHTDAYNDFLHFGTVANIASFMGDSVNMWNNILAHPDLDDWWEDRNVSYHFKDVKPAILVIGGLFDAEDCYGALRTYKAIRDNSPSTTVHLIEGPWSHGAWRYDNNKYFGDIYFGNASSAEYYAENIEYPFFSYYLDGKGKKPTYGAMVFDTGSCQWTTYDEPWPLNIANPTPFYLNQKGKISNTPQENAVVAQYISDPDHPVSYTMKPILDRPKEYMLADQRFASQRPDVATFTTETLTSPLSLAGEVTANLDVAISTTDADFIVKIIDVFPDDYAYPDSILDKYHENTLMAGYQMLVRGEVMRGKYRNSFRNPEPFTPNKPTKVSFTLPDVAHTFLPGHKLMIQVQSTWFPLVDRNPQKFCNIYKCSETDFQKSEIKILGSSNIVLPIAN